MSIDFEKKNILNEIVSLIFRAPYAKRHRALFSHEQFQGKSSEELSRIVNLGPVAAGVSREELNRRAKKLVENGGFMSACGSFVLGLVDRIAKFLTVPVDLVQFFVFTLRIAQELSYLYGEEDWWLEDKVSRESAINMGVVYVGAMLGVSQAEEAIANRIAHKAGAGRNGRADGAPSLDAASAAITGELSSKLLIPTLIKGFAASVPVVGGVISGGYTAITLIPAGKRLEEILARAAFEKAPEPIVQEKPMATVTEKPISDPHEEREAAKPQPVQRKEQPSERPEADPHHQD
jgi:hypothetical protein